MPMYRGGATTGNSQFFPGEGAHYHGTTNNVSISAWVIPADYYSHPEVYGFPEAPTPWGYTEERRATLALYEYRKGIGD